MAISDKKIEYKLELNRSQFTRSIALAAGESDKFNRKLSMSLKTSGDEIRKISLGFAAVGVAAAAVAAGGLLAFKSILTETISLANTQEKSEARLAAVVKATGEAAGLSFQEMKKMAEGLQKVTTIGDETIISAEAMLATFKSIGKNAFRPAMMAALDLSAVMEQDLKSSIVQIGKALNDPIAGISALTRVGVSFTDAQKEQIKVLQQSGDLYGAQAIILKELQSEFGGAAEALRGTFAGSLKAAQNAFGDFGEEIGATVTKNEFFILSAQLIEQVLIELTAYVKQNRQQFAQLAKDIGVGLVDGILGAVETIRFFYNAWEGLAIIANGAVTVIATGLGQLAEGLRLVLKPLDLLLTGLAKIGVIDSNPLKDFEKSMKGFGEFSAGKVDELINKVSDTNKKFDEGIKIVEEFKAKIQSIPAAYKDATENVSKQTQEVSQHMEEIKGIWVQVADTAEQESDKSTAKQIQNTDKFKGAIDSLHNSIKNFDPGSGAAKSIDDAKKSTEQLTAESEAYNKAWNKTWEDFLKSGSDDISVLKKALDELSKDRTVTVHVKEESSSGANSYTGYAKGGNPFFGGLSGYGGGDRRLIMVEDGEHVIRKEAVARLGHGFFQRFNVLNFPQMPKFATGGAVGAVAGAKTENHWHFHGNNISAISRKNARENVQLTLSEMQRQSRRSSS